MAREIHALVGDCLVGKLCSDTLVHVLLQHRNHVCIDTTKSVGLDPLTKSSSPSLLPRVFPQSFPERALCVFAQTCQCTNLTIGFCHEVGQIDPIENSISALQFLSKNRRPLVENRCLVFRCHRSWRLSYWKGGVSDVSYRVLIE